MAIFTPDKLKPVGDTVTPIQKGMRRVSLDLSSTSSEDTVIPLLQTEISRIITPSSFLFKSLYDFDIESNEGVTNLLHLLPILDPDIIKLLVVEIWPGYPTDRELFNIDHTRSEIKGYLLDLVEGGMIEEGQEGEEGEEATGGGDFPLVDEDPAEGLGEPEDVPDAPGAVQRPGDGDVPPT
jgi:hypothetical protein